MPTRFRPAPVTRPFRASGTAAFRPEQELEMYLHPLPAESPLPTLLAQHEKRLTDTWIAEQLAAPTQRFDLIDETTLERQCRDLVDCVAQVSAEGAGEPLDSESWKPLRDFLEEITVDRDSAGFSVAETSRFVLSLKHPLQELINREKQGEARDDLIWQSQTLVDQLALIPAEVVQERREATIERQRDEMEELSTPVVKVWDGILAMPLVGTLDTRRSQKVTEALLEALSSTSSEIAILDLTGVPAVDTRMAQHLIRTVAAARLMGADCILCGIRPQIAQTIVHLQINLGDIATEASLASALRAAFQRSGLRVVTS